MNLGVRYLDVVLVLLGAAVAIPLGAPVLGFAIGVLHAAIVLGVLVMICQLLRLDGERWWHESRLIPYAERVANGLRTLVGDEHRHLTRV